MTELPSGWRVAELGTVCKITSGATPKTAVNGYWGGGIPWITPMDMSKDRSKYLSGGSRSITTAGLDSCSATLVPKGSVIFSSRAPIGYVAIAANDLATNQGCKSATPPDFIDSEYLYHYLQWKTPEIRTRASGTTFLEISGRKFAETELAWPLLDEQRRIVSILEDHLSRLDAGMSGLDSALALAVQLLGAMRQEAVGLASVDTPLADVASIQGGIQKQPKRRPQSNCAPFLRVANVTPLGLDLADVHEIELFAGEMDRYRLEAGDLLVVEGNGSPAQIGRAAVWGGQIADCVHQNHLIRVRPSSRLNPKFLEIIWNAPSTRKRLTAVSSSTSGLHTLSVAKLKAMPICVPGLDEQDRYVREFEAEVASMDRLMQAVSAQRKRGIALRGSLLGAAFSGCLSRGVLGMSSV